MRWRWVIARHLVRDRTRLTGRVVDVHGCTLDMSGCPKPNVVIDVDACGRESVDVASALRGQRKCDYVLLSGHHRALDVLFIEAKTSDYHRKLRDKVSQIVSSRAAFENLRTSCEPRVTVSSYSGIVVSNIVQRSTAILARLRRVNAESGVSVRLAKCGEDIWNALAAQ